MEQVSEHPQGIQFGPGEDPRIPKEKDPLGEDFERGLFDQWIDRTAKKIFWGFLDGVADVGEYITITSESLSERANEFFLDTPRLLKKGAVVFVGILAVVFAAVARVVTAPFRAVDNVMLWAVGKTIGIVSGVLASIAATASAGFRSAIFGKTGGSFEGIRTILDATAVERQRQLPTGFGGIRDIVKATTTDQTPLTASDKWTVIIANEQ